MKLLIRGGRVIDPANDRDGVADVAVEDGRIVELDESFEPDRTLAADGCVVMPAGVDVHCHIAGASVNRARRLLGVEAPILARLRRGERQGTPPSRWDGVIPNSFLTGHRYAALGYGTAMEAAVSPSGARQCALEFRDTPNLDKGFLVLLANHSLLLDLLQRGEVEAAADAANAILARCGAYGIKCVNPGGVALWKSASGVVDSIDQTLGSSSLTPRSILEFLATLAETNRLPHPVHIHANRLGLAGNVETTLATSKALSGQRHHLAHVQFHAYGDDGDGGLSSGATRLAEYLNTHDEVTADVGQVLFEEAVTLSADLQLEHMLWQLTGARYASVELELESGCGIVPIRYQSRSFVHTLQWAVGLELFLLARDPWRLALSTDHPNGGSFLTYPKLIALLMSRDLRRETMASANAKALESSSLPALEREYTLSEIAIVTRAGPARILGMKRKGQLGAGADADITVYNDLPDREMMFRHPKWVILGGNIVVAESELSPPQEGRTYRSPLEVANCEDGVLRRWFSRHASYQLEQLGPGRDELARSHVVAG